MRLAVSVLLVLLASSLLVAPSASAQTHAPSATLRIQGDAQLVAQNFTGAGTEASPYRIEWRSFVTAGDAAIQLLGTRKHVVIANVTIQGAGADAFDGIRLVDAQNVTIQHADIQFTRTGILLDRAPRAVVGNSTIRAGGVGILLEGTTDARIHDNRIAVNGDDILLRSTAGRSPIHSVRNVFGHNELSISTGQMGFSFSSTHVYDNEIDASNVVNFVPVRWYTHLAGTLDAPAVATGEVYVKGVTNVGQIVCYNCSHVRFERNNATSGVAAGLLIEAGRNVTIQDAFAQGNDAAGIWVRNSTNVTVVGATLQDNGPHGDGAGLRAQSVNGLEVVGVAASENRYGLHVTDSGVRVRGSSLTGNHADGILLQRVTGALTSDNLVRGNAGNGIRVAGGSAAHLQNETLTDNGGAGASLDGVLGASVSGSQVDRNAKGGIMLQGRTLLAARVHNNTLAENGDAGLVFSEDVALARAEDNVLQDHARHVRFARRAEQNFLDRNTILSGPGQVGIHFDEESAYNNNVAASNTVDGTPVQWLVALVGRPDAPLVLRDLRVETENVTNVAQIMLYKSSYVHLISPVASHGARGVYALHSSSLTIDDARTNGTATGIELYGTQTALVRRASAADAEVGVRLSRTQNVTVLDTSVENAATAVLLDADSRGALVERTDASGAKRASVTDPTAAKTPRNLIADAGLDKLAGAGRNVTFSDAMGVVRFGSERIVRQSWSFGDGEEETNASSATFRPTHVYAAPGAYVARYELETADGIVLSDTVNVRIVPPPDAPPEVLGNITAKKNGVALNWTAPPSEFPITGYTVYRGLDANELVRMLETVNNATTVEEQFDASMRVFYAISASTGIAGEGPLSEPFELVYEPPPPPPPPQTPSRPTRAVNDAPDEGEDGEAAAEEGGSAMPVGGWLVLLAVAGAALLAGRRRRA